VDQAEKAELSRIVTKASEAAATKALQETFKLFGVDLTDQDHVNAFRDDLVYARKLRRLAEKGAAGAFLAVCTAITLGIGKMIWDMIANAPKPHG
jgi:hypothetical protein